MEQITVDCPSCTTTHPTKRSGHSNIVCTKCKTEFSVFSKNGAILSVSEVLRATSNGQTDTTTESRNPYYDVEEDYIPRRKSTKYERRALWFGVILLGVFLIRFPRPILLLIIGGLIFLLWRSYYKR